MNFVLKTSTETLYDIEVAEGSFAFINSKGKEIYKEWEDLSESDRETLSRVSSELQETFHRLSQICHYVLRTPVIKKAL